MPALENHKHERFAQELAKGKSASEAYVLAGYSKNDGNAIRLKGNERVLKRVAEIQDRGAIRAEVTVQSLMDELDAALALAMEKGQVSAAVAAIREKGILSGKRIERSEQGQPGEFDRMDPDELRRFILDEAQALGFGDERASAKGRSGLAH